MIIFGIIAASFLILRSVARPESFGWYGHYRGFALEEIASRPVAYSSSKTCGECHEDEFNQHAGGVHARIGCQTCHGSGKAHIEEPDASNIQKPVPAQFCVRCHEKTSARPKRFPQINVADHAEGKSCGACHVIHNPGEVKESP
jgi:hypothetical protein